MSESRIDADEPEDDVLGDLLDEVEDLDVTYDGSADPREWRSANWPMCLRHNPQRVRHPVSYFIEDSLSRQLELHVPLARQEMMCGVYAEEDREEVRVRVLVCCTPHDWEATWADGNYSLCPAVAHLLEKLRDRRVIDLDTGEQLVPQPSFYPSQNAIRASRRVDTKGR